MKPSTPPIRRFAQLPAPGWMAVCRGASLGLSVLLCLNLAEVLVHSTSAVDNWLCNLEPMPSHFALAMLAMAATCLMLFALRPALPGPVWISSGTIVVLFLVGCGREVYQIQQTITDPDRITAMIKPMGVMMLFLVTGIGVLTGNSTAVQGRSSFFAIIISAALAFLSFVVVELQSGGLSDALPAKSLPIVMVLGTSLHTDGTATDELNDRVNTGVKLLNDRMVKRVFLSGGPGHNGTSQADAMKSVVLSAGIDESSIRVDETEARLEASIANLSSLPELKANREAMIVSHWHELARCRILARRHGIAPTGIAANQKHALFNQNTLVAKETVSLMKALVEPAIALIRTSAPAKADATAPTGSSSDSSTPKDDDEFKFEELKSMEL